MGIAVIGMGNVASALGHRWAQAEHDVTFCVRNPADAKKRTTAEAMKASIGPVQDAAKAEAILLAIPWHAVPDALKATGDLFSKVLLDCANPVNADFTALTIGHTTSAGEEVARLVPQAHMVKVFNTNGAKSMADPDYDDHKGNHTQRRGRPWRE